MLVTLKMELLQFDGSVLYIRQMNQYAMPIYKGAKIGRLAVHL